MSRYDAIIDEVIAPTALTMAGQGKPSGMVEQGNIDLLNRPTVRNPDGTSSSVRSISVGIDGREVLIPTVSDDGRILTDEEATDLYRKTGRHLGKFESVDAANQYADTVHRQQEGLGLPTAGPYDSAIDEVLSTARPRRATASQDMAALDAWDLKRRFVSRPQEIVQTQEQTGLPYEDVFGIYDEADRSANRQQTLDRLIISRRYKGLLNEMTYGLEAGGFNVEGAARGTLGAVTEWFAKSPMFYGLTRFGPLDRQVPAIREAADEWNRQADELYQIANSPVMMAGQGAGAGGWLTNTIARTAPMMGLSVVAGVATGGTAGPFLVAGIIEGDNWYREAIAGGASEEEAQLGRIVVGTINGVIEVAQVGQIMRLGKGATKEVTQAFAREASERTLKKLARVGGKLTQAHLMAAIHEGMEEVGQEWVGEGAATLLYNKPMDIEDMLLRRTPTAFAGGAGAGFFLGAPAFVFNATTEIAEAVRKPAFQMPMAATPETYEQNAEKLVEQIMAERAEETPSAEPEVQDETAAAVAEEGAAPEAAVPAAEPAEGRAPVAVGETEAAPGEVAEGTAPAAEGTPEARKRIERAPEAECFKNAVTYGREHDDEGAVIVHGTVTKTDGTRIDHAWVEIGDRVVDTTAGIDTTKEDYYSAVSAAPTAKYTVEQAQINVVRINNWGPWTKDEVGNRVLEAAEVTPEAKQPWEMEKKEYEDKYPVERKGYSSIAEGERLDAIPNDEYIWVFHATTKETADRFAEEGIDPSGKPLNLARIRAEAGEEAEYAPGRGLAPGLTVGIDPRGISGYGRQTIAVRVRRGDIKVSPEQADLGVKSSGVALASNDAYVSTTIPAQDVMLIGEYNREPGHPYDELKKAALVQTEPTLAPAVTPEAKQPWETTGSEINQDTPLYHGSVSGFEGTPKTSRGDLTIGTGTMTIPGRDVFEGFYTTPDRSYARLYSRGDEGVIQRVWLRPDAKVVDLSDDIVSQEVLGATSLARSPLSSLKPPSKPFPFQQEFEKYAIWRFHEARRANNATPQSDDWIRQHAGLDPSKDNWNVNGSEVRYLEDFLREQGYDAIRFQRETIVLNPKAAYVGETNPWTDAALAKMEAAPAQAAVRPAEAAAEGQPSTAEDIWNRNHPISYKRALELSGVTEFPGPRVARDFFEQLTPEEQQATIDAQNNDVAAWQEELDLARAEKSFDVKTGKGRAKSLNAHRQKKIKRAKEQLERAQAILKDLESRRSKQPGPPPTTTEGKESGRAAPPPAEEFVWGASNTGVTRAEYESIKARLASRGKLPGGRQAGGTALFDPETWSDAVKVAQFHLEAGARALTEWSGRMIADFGEAVQPHLDVLWRAAQGEEVGAPTEPQSAPPGEGASHPEATPDADHGEPRLTSARQAWVNRQRTRLGLDGINSKMRRTWAQAMADAWEQKIPEDALRIAGEILAKPEAMSDVETAGLLIRCVELENEHAELMAKIGPEKNAASIADLSARIGSIEAEYDTISRAIHISGSEKGRALNAQKMTINENFSLVAVKARAKAAKGAELTAKESKKFEDLAAKMTAQSDKIEALEKELNKIKAEQMLKKLKGVQRYASMNRQALTNRLAEMLEAGCY